MLSPITSYNTKKHTKINFMGLNSNLRKLSPLNSYMNKVFDRFTYISKNRWLPVDKNLKPYLKTGNIQNEKQKIPFWEINPGNSQKYIIFYHGLGQNISTNQEMYKKIIDKRMTAYEYLEFVISKIEVIQEIFDDYRLKQGEGKNIYSCFMNKEMLAETCENIISVSKYDLWLSNEVRIKLSEINLIIANALTSINCPNKRNLEFYGLNIQKDNNDKLSIKIGIYEYKKMSKLINEVRTIMAKDIKTLDEIVPFFDNLLKK